MTSSMGNGEEERASSRVMENGGGGRAAAVAVEARPPPSPPHPTPPRPGDLLGRHRLAAAISRLNQEIQSLEEELEELDTMEPSSAACKEIVFGTEGIPDALLPVTRGPDHASWDRWFQRVRSSHGRRWWTPKGSDFF